LCAKIHPRFFCLRKSITMPLARLAQSYPNAMNNATFASDEAVAAS
jgi:hypothetical protein